MTAESRVLAALLKLAGLRQIEVAQALGVSRSRLGGWLSGYAPMPDEAVLEVHRLVGERIRLMDGRVAAIDRGPELIAESTGDSDV